MQAVIVTFHAASAVTPNSVPANLETALAMHPIDAAIPVSYSAFSSFCCAFSRSGGSLDPFFLQVSKVILSKENSPWIRAARQVPRCRERPDRRATRYAVPRRRLDRSPGRASPPGQPRERLHSLEARAHRKRAHHQDLRGSPLGRARGHQVHSRRSFARAARKSARPLGAFVAFAEGVRCRAHLPPSRSWRAH